MPGGAMTGHTGHVKSWAEQSDIDWFTLFVKAWIPFNAYFQNAYEEDQERKILDEIKRGSNPIRSQIVELLRQNDPDGDSFRQYIGELHRLLSSLGLTNRGRLVSFEACYLGENTKTKEVGRVHGIDYHVERKRTGRPPKEVFCEMKQRNNAVCFTHTQSEYNKADLRTLPSFLALSERQRKTLMGYYESVQPDRIVNLLDRGGTINMAGVTFCDDRELIFEAILQTLYALRCLLFHGEIVPSATHNAVYQPAYFILRRLLKCVL